MSKQDKAQPSDASTALMDVALEVLMHNGIGDNTLELIAQASGVPVEQALELYPTIDAYLAACLDRSFTDVLDKARIWLATTEAHDVCALDRLLFLFRALLLTSQEDSEWYLCIGQIDAWRSQGNCIATDEQYESFDRSMSRIVQGLIEEGRSDGSILADVGPEDAEELVVDFNGVFARVSLESCRTHSSRHNPSGIVESYLRRVRLQLGHDSSFSSTELDVISGLYRRDAFYKHAHTWLEEHPDDECCILVFDIDRFKVYNDRFGTIEGDRLLSSIGTRLIEYSSAGVISSRMSADRFAVLAPCTREQIDADVTPILNRLDLFKPNQRISVHVGAYLVESRGIDVRGMIDRALVAQQLIKGDAERYINWYDEEMRLRLMRDEELEQDIVAAFERDEFVPYIQPQYNHVTGELFGAEALVRWIHPERGLVSPGEFIPILERNGLIGRIDALMLTKVCEHIEDWTARGIDVVPISVNLSRAELLDEGLTQRIVDTLAAHNVPHDLIRLEVTETTFHGSPERVTAVINELRDQHFLIEMDDFGSGYSSLNSLKDMPIDIIKLDLEFLRGSNEGRGGIVLNSVVQMARWLGLTIIAEGVETDRQSDYLRTIGCRYVQGYYFSRPLPVDEFEKVMCTQVIGADSHDMHIASFFDSKEFWDPDAQSTIIFNSFVGAAGLFLCDGSTIVAQRLNDVFYSETGFTRQQFDDQTDVTTLCHPDDIQPMVEAMRYTWESGEEVPFECRWLTGPNGSARWLSLRSRRIAMTDTRCMLYVSVRDITDHRKLELEQARLNEELKVERDRTRVVLENSLISTWDYDIASKTVRWRYRMRNDFRSQGEVVTNVPESIIESGIIFDDSIASYRHLYDEVLSGEPRAETTLHVRGADGREMWQRLCYHTIFRDGKPVGASGSSIDVTDSFAKNQRYWHEMAMIEESDSDNLLESGLVDVVTATLEERFTSGRMESLRDDVSYREQLIDRLPYVRTPEQREQLAQLFDSDYLAKCYVSLNKRLTLEYQRLLRQDDVYVWLELVIKLYQEPESGTLKAFYYLYDIDDRHQARDAIRAVCDAEFDRVAIINTRLGTVRMLEETTTGPLSTGTLGPAAPLGERMPQFVTGNLVEKDRVKALNELSLASIVQALTENPGSYKRSYSMRATDGDSSVRRACWEFMWLDREQGTIVVTRQDVTELFSAESSLNLKIMGLAAAQRSLVERSARPRLFADESSELIEEYEIALAQNDLSVAILDLATNTMTRHLLDGTPLGEPLADAPESLIRKGYVDPDSREVLHDLFDAMRRGEPVGSAVVHMHHMPSEDFSWFKVTYSLVTDLAGNPRRSVITTQRMADDVDFAAALSVWRDDVNDSLAHGATFFEVNITNGVVEAVRGSLAIKEGSYTDVLAQLGQYINPEDVSTCADLLDPERLCDMCHAGILHDSFEYRLRTSSDEPWRWYRSSATLATHPYTADVLGFFTLSDVDAAHREREERLRAANVDPLTGVRNRASVHRAIKARLGMMADDSQVAALIVDIDNFKEVNDTLGHQAGDAALKRLATALVSRFRSDDVVGRLGGDEFIVFMAGTLPDVTKRALALVHDLRFDEDGVHVSASVGAVQMEARQATIDSLYALSDKAMYRAKHLGKSRCVIVDDSGTELYSGGASAACEL